VLGCRSTAAFEFISLLSLDSRKRGQGLVAGKFHSPRVPTGRGARWLEGHSPIRKGTEGESYIRRARVNLVVYWARVLP